MCSSEDRKCPPHLHGRATSLCASHTPYLAPCLKGWDGGPPLHVHPLCRRVPVPPCKAEPLRRAATSNCAYLDPSPSLHFHRPGPAHSHLQHPACTPPPHLPCAVPAEWLCRHASLLARAQQHIPGSPTPEGGRLLRTGTAPALPFVLPPQQPPRQQLGPCTPPPWQP
jgi:hypothetical protein